MDESLLPKELRTQTEDALPKAKKAIAGNATVKKPSLGKKFRDTFVADDVGSVKEYIIYDQIVPAIIDAIYNTVVGTMSMIFYGRIRARGDGRKRSNRTWDPSSGTQFSYDKVSDRRDDQPARRRNSSMYVEEIVVETYNDAAAVLDELIAYLEQYGRVPVSAYYDAFDVSGDRDWTNVRWGWKSLREARVVPVRGGGYTLEMPSPEPL